MRHVVLCIFDGFRQWKGINGMLKADVDRLMIDFDFDFKYWLRSPPQWSIRRRDGAERPTRLIAQLALESCYWSGFNSSWWKVIPIRYSFVQKGILSQRGVSSYVFKWCFMSTTSWYNIFIYIYIFFRLLGLRGHWQVERLIHSKFCTGLSAWSSFF